jgi:D-isomer specific 2-hydroxyacid dehydrogenase, NAD binding domain
MSNLQAPSSSLEVTRSLLDCARTARFRFGEDTALVAVQHMLYQTVDLFGTVSEMGLNSKNIFALGKVYSNSLPVISTLRDMGVSVIDTTVPEPGEFHSYFERDINKLWQVAAQNLVQRRIKRILVLDDAGVCITSVPPDVLRRYEVCGVEQTSQGIFLFEEKAPPFAVISWARAALKSRIGGPVFSQCFIDKLNTEFLRGKTLQGQPVGIIGLGSIGRAVATFALSQDNEVFFYDPDPNLQVPFHLHQQLTRLDSLEELMMRCEYVLGCSGRNPFEGKWPLKHRPGIRLLSASGGDQEFGPIIKDLKERPGFEVAPDTWDITSEHGPCGHIHIAYLGYPYNFVSRGNEAVWTRIVQLETGGLLAALMQARLYLELCETNQEQNKEIQRMSITAQRCVYERWLAAMKDWHIDITELFGYDSATLSAARDDAWLMQHTEPLLDDRSELVKTIETKMSQLLCVREVATLREA